MSRNINNNKKNSANTDVKKYCKVCHDAGKSEIEYLSHFIRESRDPNSKIVCPTLLSLECRYCSNKGHTIKYCKILEKNKNMSSRQERINNYHKTEKNDVKYKESSNIFDNLGSDSEEEDEEFSDIRAPNSTLSDNFSEICSNSVPKSYASVLSTPVAKPVATAIPVLTRMSSVVNLKQETTNIPVTVPIPKSVAKPFDKYKGKSWADTDSESDVEEFDYEYDPNW
jgi:hypothetical protein